MIMRRILVALLLTFGALSVSAAPAMPASSYSQQQDKKKDSKKKKTQTVSFKTSMHCKNCVKKITDNISFEKGVKDLKVSLDNKLVTITYDPSKTEEATLAKAIEKLGYTVETVREQ